LKRRKKAGNTRTKTVEIEPLTAKQVSTRKYNSSFSVSVLKIKK